MDRAKKDIGGDNGRGLRKGQGAGFQIFYRAAEILEGEMIGRGEMPLCKCGIKRRKTDETEMVRLGKMAGRTRSMSVDVDRQIDLMARSGMLSGDAKSRLLALAGLLFGHIKVSIEDAINKELKKYH